MERIEYANGIVEQFAMSQTKMEFMKRNLIGLNYLDLFISNFSLTYEYLLGENQNLVLYMPVRVRFAKDESTEGNVFGLGTGFMFYPFGQRRISYYTGPLVTYSIRDYSYSDLFRFITYTYRHNFLGGYIVSGIKSNFNDRVGMNVNIGLGFLRDLDYSDIDPDEFHIHSSRTRFDVTGEISLFYRF